MNVGISRVGQIAITARDIDRATAFLPGQAWPSSVIYGGQARLHS